MLGNKIKQAILKSTYGSVAKFAEEIGLTKQGLYYKIKTDNFTVKDIEVISKALNVEFPVLETEPMTSNKVNEKRNELFSLRDEISSLKKEVQEWKEKYLNLLELLAKPEKERLSAGKRRVSKDAIPANPAKDNVVLALFA